MTNKKTKLDILGTSHLPSDLLTPSLGSSYLIGEDPDLEYGMGTLDAVVNPKYQKAPALPTGLNRESSERLDLQDYLTTPEITDLSWLDPSQMQDPSRLPKDPHEVLPELEELWGSVTNGRTIQKNSIDLEKLRYEQSLNSREVPVKKSSERTYEKIVTAAMRRSAMGQDIKTVIRETLDSVGEDYKSYVPAMRAVKAEHGLSGNVYIRKSAFPNFESGKWNSHIKKYHSGAQYIIVAKEDFGKTFIEDGRCRYTGKKAVLKVPWDSAWAYYAPRLQSTGHRLASGDKKQALRIAFLKGPEKTQHKSNLPVQHNPADMVSRKQAQQEFDSYKPKRKVYDPTDANVRKMHIAIERKLNQMVRDLGLPKKEATAILSSGAHPKDMLRSASLIVARVKTGDYSGHKGGLESLVSLQRMAGQRELESSIRGIQELSKRSKDSSVDSVRALVSRKLISKGAAEKILSSNVSNEEKVRIATQLAMSVKKSQYAGNNYGIIETARSLEETRDLTASQKEIEKRIRQKDFQETEQGKIASQVQKLAGKIEHEIKRGIKGDTLKSFIKRTVPRERMRSVLAKIKPLLDSTGALKNKTAKTAQYQGAVFTEEKAENQQRGVLAGNIRKASQWLRRTLSEGFAGKELDSLLQNKFSDSLLKAASGEFTNIRKQHEGASGFLYVDASAYASDSGSKGCEKASAKHRVNGIPAVAAMDRCGSCAHNKVLADGTPRCGIFNKTLLFDVEIPDKIKQKNIRSTNMTDAEVTASLFSSVGAEVYDPGEFGLKNSNLEDIEFEDVPETEKLSKILFDGWDID